MKYGLLPLVLLIPLAGAAQETRVAPEPTPPPAEIPPNSPLVDDIIRLWKANLSEQFIDKYVAHSALERDLTADDVIRLRNAGVPESLIASVTLRRTAPERAPAGAPTPGTPGARDTRRWEGLVRRNSGMVILKSRWDPGILEFKDGSLRWTDARDVKKNLLVPASQITEQQLTCLKKVGGNECFEWVAKTKHEEYRFRDVGWEQGEDAKVEELFGYFQTLFPSLISSRQPVSEK
jgi:hypothetical protein